MKRAGSGSRAGSRSLSQRYGSVNPDPYPHPYQNVTDPEHCGPESGGGVGRDGTTLQRACTMKNNISRSSTQQRNNTENSKQMFPEKELCGLSPNSYIHVSLFFCRKIGGPIEGIYKSLADT